ncbi:hypothetical protein HanIR_Chr12g0610971 [Helianthus annuus]|nr:hypothetical protein HanIR_Chr12g0610971 [Helianthus annuus]
MVTLDGACTFKRINHGSYGRETRKKVRDYKLQELTVSTCLIIPLSDPLTLPRLCNSIIRSLEHTV